MSQPLFKTKLSLLEGLAKCLAALLTAVLLAHTLGASSVAERLRNNFYDSEHSYFSQKADFSDLVIVDIDDVSLDLLKDEYGVWPYKRQLFAQLHNYLKDSGAKKVVYTALFSENRSGDSLFAAAIRAGSPTVLSASVMNASTPVNGTIRQNNIAWPFSENAQQADSALSAIPKLSGISLPVRELTDAGAKIGLAVRPLDYDEVFRAYQPVFRIEQYTLPSLPLAILLADKNVAEQSLVLKSLQPYLSAKGLLRPLFATNASKIKRLPLFQLIFDARDHEERVSSGFVGQKRVNNTVVNDLTDKVVIVGVTANLIGKGASATPIMRLNTPQLIGNLYHSLKHKLLLVDKGRVWGPWLALLGAFLPLLAFFSRRPPSISILLISAVAISIIVIFQVITYAVSYTLIDPVLPILSTLFSMIICLTYRYRMESQLSRHLEIERRTAERASELKSQFLTNITHELRTPLTSVLGYNQMLRDDFLTQDERARYHKVVDSNCRHLLALIGNLLSEAEIESGQVTLKSNPTLLNEMLAVSLSSVEGLAINKAIELRGVVTERTPVCVMLDPLRVQQVIINLVSNSVKYTNEGLVLVVVDWVKNQLEIKIKDTGVGMTQDQLGSLFSRYKNRHEVRLDSSGIGLAICHELIELMGGKIHAHSAVGKGTEMTVWLPTTIASMPNDKQQEASRDSDFEVNKSKQNDDEQQAVAESVQSNAVDVGAGSSNDNNRDGVVNTAKQNADLSAEMPSASQSPTSIKVMIVDDNPDIRDLISLYLMKEGYAVLAAEDAESGLTMANTHKPAMIFMDLDLPGMSGREAVAELRNQGCTAAIYICSAAASVGIIDGADGYLPKPMNREELLKIVAKVANQ